MATAAAAATMTSPPGVDAAAVTGTGTSATCPILVDQLCDVAFSDCAEGSCVVPEPCTWVDFLLGECETVTVLDGDEEDDTDEQDPTECRRGPNGESGVVGTPPQNYKICGTTDDPALLSGAIGCEPEMRSCGKVGFCPPTCRPPGTGSGWTCREVDAAAPTSTIFKAGGKLVAPPDGVGCSLPVPPVDPPKPSPVDPTDDPFFPYLYPWP